jgi:NAD-dependent dihydropyrimidine dehydrogenase PreA subunit
VVPVAFTEAKARLRNKLKLLARLHLQTGKSAITPDLKIDLCKGNDMLITYYICHKLCRQKSHQGGKANTHHGIEHSARHNVGDKYA